MVGPYQRNPDKWQDTRGRTAHERWTTWFKGVRDRLRWRRRRKHMLSKDHNHDDESSEHS